jgi:hypothetical protein
MDKQRSTKHTSASLNNCLIKLIDELHYILQQVIFVKYSHSNRLHETGADVILRNSSNV